MSPPEIHLNMRVRGLQPSATVAINERADALRRQGRRIFKLGLGQSPFPVPEAVGRALSEHAFEKDYLPVKGLLRLRESIATHHRRTFGIECTPDDVIIGPGSKELMFLTQLVYYGELVIPAPAWVSYAPQATIIGRRITVVPTWRANRWRLTPAELDELCRPDPTRPRLLILNYPSNPTGQTYTADELAELAEVMRRYKVVVISDEIYGKIHHRGEHSSIAPLYPEGTIFSGGLSKWCGAGGWRLGLFVIPGTMRWMTDALAAVASETFTSTSAPIQHAAVTAFDGSPELDRYLAGSRRVLRALGLHISGALRDAGADVDDPEGGFYLFPDLSAHAQALADRGVDGSKALCEQLLQDTGVAVLPGVDFGRPPAELTLRLAYVDFDGAASLAAVAARDDDDPLDEAFLRRCCGSTLEAVDRLCEWLPGATSGRTRQVTGHRPAP